MPRPNPTTDFAGQATDHSALDPLNAKDMARTLLRGELGMATHNIINSELSINDEPGTLILGADTMEQITPSQLTWALGSGNEITLAMQNKKLSPALYDAQLAAIETMRNAIRNEVVPQLLNPETGLALYADLPAAGNEDAVRRGPGATMHRIMATYQTTMQELTGGDPAKTLSAHRLETTAATDNIERRMTNEIVKEGERLTVDTAPTTRPATPRPNTAPTL